MSLNNKFPLRVSPLILYNSSSDGKIINLHWDKIKLKYYLKEVIAILIINHSKDSRNSSLNHELEGETSRHDLDVSSA